MKLGYIRKVNPFLNRMVAIWRIITYRNFILVVANTKNGTITNLCRTDFNAKDESSMLSKAKEIIDEKYLKK